MTYGSLAVVLKIEFYRNKYYDILSCEEPKYIIFLYANSLGWFRPRPSRPQRLHNPLVTNNLYAGFWDHTVKTDVVGLHESLLDLAVLDKQGVTLAAVVSKDGSAVEGHIQGLGELATGVTQEADLSCSVSTRHRVFLVQPGYKITYAALALGVKGGSPCLGAVVGLTMIPSING